MNLANKYRPKTFEDYVEQSMVVEVIKGLCSQEKLDNRNFLLIGPAGTGKTTIAGIIARTLNNGQGEPIEVDAASHNGVESVRELIQQAQAYPVGCKYKVFILDECFPKDTWVSTPRGLVKIQDIQEGDSVYNLTGQATVSRVFKNSVKTNNLVSVRVGGRSIVTTKDHLFFTDNGWITACNLKEGDFLYDYASMQGVRSSLQRQQPQRSKNNLQQGVSEDIHEQENDWAAFHVISENMSDLWEDLLDHTECKFNNLFQRMWTYLEETERDHGVVVGSTFKALAYIYLSRMREVNGGEKQRSSDCMLSFVCNEDSTEADDTKSCSEIMSMVRKYIYCEILRSKQENVLAEMPCSIGHESAPGQEVSRIVETNGCKQPYEGPNSSLENDENQRAEWNITSADCISWWERTLHQAADSAASDIRGGVDIRISRAYKDRYQEQSDELSYELQTRPCLSRVVSGSRGGWCRSSYEVATVARREKSNVSSELRVDGVEVYQPGNNDELFSGSFSDYELSQEYVTMYDLEVDGHPSYFANGVLAHNCHAFSSQSWQCWLKTLETGAGRSIFIFCTTNPEKIPATILSRVQTFQLSKISLDGITNRLKYVIECENKEGRDITYTEDAISYIAKLANGGLRDSLTTLDKALAYSTDLNSENLAKALNLPQYDDYFRLLAAYAKKDNTSISAVIDQVYNSGVNFVRWFEGFHSFVINVVKYIFLQDIEKTMIPSHYKEKISKYGPAHSAVCLKLANKLLSLNADLKSTQYLQEVALTYLCSIPKKEQ